METCEQHLKLEFKKRMVYFCWTTTFSCWGQKNRHNAIAIGV